jgi:DNA mismatch endonuclease (patch repair protein)
MAAIRSRDTKPEMVVRRIVHAMGYRYRLHVADLPGKPDLVFPRLSKVIFVHGCFWHMHRCANGRVMPKSNVPFWRAKRESNVERDRVSRRRLTHNGWRSLTVWECQTRSREFIEHRLIKFLGRITPT